MIDMQRIQTFLSAAENLSFSEAAKQLHLSQPTVSHHIKTLESELGAVLFDRSAGGLRLTDAGRLLLPWAQRLLRETNDLEAIMSSFQDVTGELCIACSTTAGKYILPQLAARFRQRYPGIHIKIPACAPEMVAQNMMDGEAHIGVLSREISTPNLEIQEFFTDKIILIAPAGHRWARSPFIDVSELIQEPLILREPSSGTRSVVFEELAKHDIRLEDLNVFMELGNAEAIVRTVAAGFGVGFVSELAADYPLENGDVVNIHIEGINLQRTIYMIKKRIGDPNRPRDAFWSFIHAPENADLLHLSDRGG